MSIPSKKFGLYTAIAMVVGIVIGSGVFKSAGDVLAKAGGRMPIAILAWLIGGAIVLVSTYSFGIVALKHADRSGIIHFIEELAGERVAYLVAWFMTTIYFPALVGILAWLAGDITNSLLGFETSRTWLLAILYFLGVYALNIAAPLLAGHWQVSATVIKLVPLILIAIVGLVVGLFNGATVTSFTTPASTVAQTGTGLAAAVAVTAFAYDGWITALSITQELVDTKKNLSRALIGGTLIVVTLYLLFFVGLAGVITNDEAISLAGSLDTSILAAERLFGTLFGPIVSVFILISVLGTLNGLTLGAVRGMYQISAKGVGPAKRVFVQLGKRDQPIASGLFSFACAIFFGIIWYGNFQGYWGGFMDTSVLPIVFLYGAFILVYLDIIRHFTEEGVVKRFVIPSLAIVGALYMIYGAFTSSPVMFFYFSIIVAIILLVGHLTYHRAESSE